MTRQYDRSPPLLDVLRSTPVGVASPEEVEQERERLVPWLEQQVRELPEKRLVHQARQRRATVWAAIGLAAGFSIAWVSSTMVGSEDEASHAAAPSALPEAERDATLVSGGVTSEQDQVLPGSRVSLSNMVRTSDTRGAHLRLDGGVELELDPSTELGSSGVPHSESLELQLKTGEVRLSVPPLHPEGRLTVRTSDAQAVVVGTKFRVSVVDEQGASATCVEVFEGRVEVTRRDGAFRRLGPQQSWGCPASSEPSDMQPSAGRTAKPKDHAQGRRGPLRAADLEKQNELLAAALAAERRGDRNAARRSFDRLIQRYPTSPFLPEARAGLARTQTKQ